MIFSPDLAEKVLAGTKVVTRRRLTHRDGRPLQYRAGGIYAIQPGRGKRHIGHVRIIAVDLERLALVLTAIELIREGFSSAGAFARYWTELHGGFDGDEVVARIWINAAPRCSECVKGGGDG